MGEDSSEVLGIQWKKVLPGPGPKHDCAGGLMEHQKFKEDQTSFFWPHRTPRKGPKVYFRMVLAS